MYQQSLDLQFPLTQQLDLNLDTPVDQRTVFYFDTSMCTTIDAVWASETVNSYITVSNSEGTGISLRMENKSWLKTKVANWLGVKYL